MSTSRRDFLCKAGSGLGMLALGRLLDAQEHFAPRAKSVIWLFMEGGPSGFDLFDYKPELQRSAGKRVDGIETFFGNPGPLLRSPYSFKRYGQSGATVCERYSTLAQCVDDIAFLKSCWAESNNHGPAMYQINTGLPRVGFPSVGSWVTYGLGSENRNLPGFVVLGNSRGAKGGPANWGSGFLPSSYQGTLFRAAGTPVLNLDRPKDVSPERQRSMLDAAAALNRGHLEARDGDGELEARIQSFEMAYRMQMAAKELVDFSGETEETRKLYGLDVPASRPFGEKCLLARRLVERGVRFVQAYINDEWDAHDDIRKNHDARCAESDVPIAGLLKDLKRQGLLDTTLVVWGGEFGRMPVSEKSQGRDHNPHGFLMWMAGGGVKGGVSYGETDEIGYKAAENPVSVHDVHATILHLLGIDHKRLTYAHNGRRYRLTDVHGNVLTPLLA
ncbi:MAG: DUF1501 domain-containing protein [Planctomycetaceae bacterium]|nr:DUF1501 domain-containing protein [Planctomycetaceae bacterium]